MTSPGTILRVAALALSLAIGAAVRPATIGAQAGAGQDSAAGAPTGAGAESPDPAAELARLKAAFDPATDDLGILAAMAMTAARAGDIGRFRAYLDSIVGKDAAGPNALTYWGALSLRDGAAPDSIRRRLDAYLDGAPRDRAALVAFFRVLTGNGALADAGQLLDRAVIRGVRPIGVAMMRGELAEMAGDPLAALDAYLVAAGADETLARTATAKIEELLDGWPTEPPLAEAVERLERSRAELPPERSIPLLVRGRVAAGDWEGGIAAARDPVLSPRDQADALRGIATAAGEARAFDAAAAAIEALLALGPPAATAADRLLMAEIEEERGDAAAAARALRGAAAGGAAGAESRALEADVAAARETGHPEKLAEAIERAVGGGVNPAAIATPQGDLWLSRGRPDSALAAYARGVPEQEDPGPGALEALARVRLVQSLLRARVPAALLVETGRMLVAAPSDPRAAAVDFERLAGAVGEGDSLEVARSLLQGLAGEWLGRGGEPAAASALLERAAHRPEAGSEGPALLLAAGRWAAEAGEPVAAAALWRELVERHPESPYALEARRLLASRAGARAPQEAAPPAEEGDRARG